MLRFKVGFLLFFQEKINFSIQDRKVKIENKNFVFFSEIFKILYNFFLFK